MSKKGAVPDAWDDDWEVAADKPAAQAAFEPAAKLSKAQRRVQHQEQQKQLWHSAENPDRHQWLEAKGVVPLKQEFKPQVTLLSRKPAATLARRNPTDGTANPGVDDEDSDEEFRRQQESSLEERQRKARLEREEKQRRYAEARERIMGSPSSAPPAASSRESSHGRDSRKIRTKVHSNRNSQPTSSADHSPARSGANGDRQLFDPDDTGRRLPRRDSPAPAKEDMPSRQPRGSDNSGRGGFGFAARGGRTGS